MSSRSAVQPAPVSLGTFALLPLVLFCLGHFFIDLYASALGVLQPLLVSRYHLSFTEAGILGGLLVFSSSVLQPVYGYLSDRFHSPLFSTLAPAMAGFFISSVAFAPGFGGLLAMVFLGGAGVASFHPQAASRAVADVTANRGRAMSIFICSGTLGMALGPTYFSEISSRVGLDRTYWAAVPGIVVTVLLVALLRQPAPAAHARPKFDWAPLQAVWKPMTILYFLVVIRSVVQISFTQFLPLYLNTQRGYSLKAASFALTLYLLGGTVGGLAGGSLADRFGGRAVILISMIGSVPFLVTFLLTQGPVSNVCLFLSGVLLLFTIPVNVVMAQDLAPTQGGLVSALMMGFAWGVAGVIFIPLTGWISDHYSMQAAFSGIVATPLIGFLLALKLPK